MIDFVADSAEMNSGDLCKVGGSPGRSPPRDPMMSLRAIHCNDSIRRRILPMGPGGTPRVSRVLSNVLSSGSGMLRKSSTSSYPSSLNSAECLARMAPNSFDTGEGPGAFGLSATPSGVGADICRRRQEKMTRGWPCMHTQYPMYASLDEIRCTPLFYMYPCTFCSMNMSYVRREV